jgi:hypothetical protein
LPENDAASLNAVPDADGQLMMTNAMALSRLKVTSPDHQDVSSPSMLIASRTLPSARSVADPTDSAAAEAGVLGSLGTDQATAIPDVQIKELHGTLQEVGKLRNDIAGLEAVLSAVKGEVAVTFCNSCRYQAQFHI